MCRKLICVVCCTFILSLGGEVSADLVGYWDLNEGGGNLAHDRSGNDNHGTLSGPAWDAGLYEQALRFNGTNSYVEVPTSESLEIDGQVTVAAWINWADSGDTWLCVMANGQQNGPWENYGLFINRASRFVYLTLALDGGHVPQQTPNNVIEPGRWQHIAGVWDGSAAKMYVDGQLALEQAQSGALVPPGLPLRIGHRSGSAHFFSGVIDEAAVFDHALTEAELQEAMAGITPAELASQPEPANEAVDVPRDVVLSWKAGRFAHSHDVYLGTTFEDVNAASRTDPRDVLIGQGQTQATYDPEGWLAFGQTYYWRVDEVNAPPSGTIYRGNVWSFAAEPLAYPVVRIIASSNGVSDDTAGPEKTIDGSGLNSDDQHSTATADMWLASAGDDPLWIQYEFDRVYKLHQMLVWNYNSQFELMLGFGLKDVGVEYSEDGTDWTAMGDVSLAQSIAKETYAANTTVDFGGGAARYVRLHVQSGYGPMGQYGLSEVRFLFIPAHARQPEPADDATGVAPDTALGWRAGREAVSHEVYLGADAETLVLIDTVDRASYAPSTLEFGSTYYWQVVEVNEADEIPSWAGEVWRFSTQEFAEIDDFEVYNDDVDAGTTIFDTWIDGWVNETGSIVGYFDAPFAERTIVHGGAQSMPLQYDNSVSPFYSETERLFETAQDWTLYGADSLVVYHRGHAPGFLEASDGSILMNGIGVDIWDASDQFRFAYRNLSGDGSIVARVESVANTHVWAKAGVMIRETLEPGSAHAMVVVTPASGVAFQRRPEANAGSESTGVADLAVPYWVKLTRAGNAFTAQISEDGESWTDIAMTPAVTIPMAADVYVGLAVTSHDATATTEVEFSNVATTGNVSGSWQVAEIGAEQTKGNSAEPLYVTLEDSSGKSAVVTNADTAATVRPSWRQWTIPLSDFGGVDARRISSMKIGVGQPGDPTAGGTGIVYIDDIGYGRPADQ